MTSPTGTAVASTSTSKPLTIHTIPEDMQHMTAEERKAAYTKALADPSSPHHAAAVQWVAYKKALADPKDPGHAAALRQHKFKQAFFDPSSPGHKAAVDAYKRKQIRDRALKNKSDPLHHAAVAHALKKERLHKALADEKDPLHQKALAHQAKKDKYVEALSNKADPNHKAALAHADRLHKITKKEVRKEKKAAHRAERHAAAEEALPHHRHHSLDGERGAESRLDAEGLPRHHRRPFGAPSDASQSHFSAQRHTDSLRASSAGSSIPPPSSDKLATTDATKATGTGSKVGTSTSTKPKEVEEYAW